MPSLLERLGDAMNAHDARQMAALFAEDYVSAQPIHPGRGFTGRDQVLANWTSLFAAIPDFTSELVAASYDGETEWGEWEWHGRHTDGSPFAMRGVTILVVRDGLVEEARLFMEPVESGGGDIVAAVRDLSQPRAAPGVYADPARAPGWGGLGEVVKDERIWRIGTTANVDWIAGRTTEGLSVTTAIPPIFEAYATFYQPDGTTTPAHEVAVVGALTARSTDQPWWLGYLDTGAHDVVFHNAATVTLYWDWPYVLVEAGPEQALGWRTGHMRSDSGSLPDLFFPADRSWLVSALWDDTWACIGGSAELIEALQRDPLVSARRVEPDQDALPPGLARD